MTNISSLMQRAEMTLRDNRKVLLLETLRSVPEEILSLEFIESFENAVGFINDSGDPYGVVPLDISLSWDTTDLTMVLSENYANIHFSKATIPHTTTEAPTKGMVRDTSQEFGLIKIHKLSNSEKLNNLSKMKNSVSHETYMTSIKPLACPDSDPDMITCSLKVLAIMIPYWLADKHHYRITKIDCNGSNMECVATNNKVEILFRFDMKTLQNNYDKFIERSETEDIYPERSLGIIH